MCNYKGLNKWTQINHPIKSTLNSRKSKNRQISYTLNIIHLQKFIPLVGRKTKDVDNVKMSLFIQEHTRMKQGVKSSYIPIFFLYFQEMANSIFPIFDQNVLNFLYFNENNKHFFLIEQLMYELCLNCKKISY